MKLVLDEHEAWVLHEHVRMTRNAPEYGTEHDLEFIRKVWACILEPGEIDLTIGELLQITRQVSAQLMQGQRPIGREVLRKAIAALMVEEEADAIAIPDAFVRAEYASEDADDGTDSGTGAEAESLGNLSRPSSAGAGEG